MRKLLLSVVALAWVAVASAQTDVTFDFNANEWEHGVTIFLNTSSTDKGNITEAVTKDGVDIVFKQSKSGTPPRFYASSATASPYARVLSNHILKVFAPEGKAVTKVEFELNAGSFNLSSESGLSGQVWEGNAAYAKFKGTGTNQIKKIIVTIADMTAETVIPTETDEVVTIDIDDYAGEDGKELTDDVAITGQENGGESRVYCVLPKTTSTDTFVSKNKWYWISSSLVTAFRGFNESVTLKTDADKIIKSVAMSVTTYNSNNTVNGEKVTKTQMTNGYDVNSSTVDFALAGQTVIKTITVTLADKPITPYTPETPTAIEKVSNDVDASNAPVFDLSGRKVTGTLTKGIYVKAGKKFVVVK